MRKLIGFIVTLAVFTACKTANTSEQVDETTQKADFGTLEIHKAFKSEFFHSRDINVWLPEDYSTEKKYAVLYMHDGQMLFDKNTSWNRQSWNVDSVATAVQSDNRTRPFIVVGIDNHPEGRLFDYMPRKALDYIPEGDTLLAKYDLKEFIADDYLKFIVKELKPFIDKTYSTLTNAENTFTMGSSMGGLISMYAICEYPDVFGGAGCISTHVPMVLNGSKEEAPIWAKAFRDYLNDKLPEANSRLIYMDRGDKTIDEFYLPFQPLIDELFYAKGWDKEHFDTHAFPGHAHDENSWESRLHIPLTFLMKN